MDKQAERAYRWRADAGDLALTRNALDPALAARAEAARALLREDPAVDRHLLFAAVVWPRDPILEHVQPQRSRRLTLNREAVERLFELRDQGVSFGAIAKQFHVPKSTLVEISQKATRGDRAAVLERHTPAGANGDGITEGEFASLITAALKRRLRRWRPFPQTARRSPPRAACLRGHEFDEENTIVRADGSRTCRTCRRASSLAYYHRQRSTPNGNGAIAYASSGGVTPGGKPSTT